MIEPEINSSSFQLAELRSERARVKALVIVLASLIALALVRGMISVIEGRRGEAWPFIVLLGAAIAYEVGWLRVIDQAQSLGGKISAATWTGNIFVESLLPTTALFLQIYTASFGPKRVLTSPILLVYLLFIILSTLHLSPRLSRLAGAFSAAGYALLSIGIFLSFPEVAQGEKLVVYSSSLSFSVLLLLAGFTAGAVADQIRLHVVAALHEVRSQAKIAELKHDLDIARSIQKALLPKTPPRIDGFDIAGWNQPAAETGGDYFDWQEVADGCLAVTVADVSGHGIGSALGMASCRAYLRAGLATETDLDSFFSRLNELLYADLPPEKFVTVVTGVLNPSEAVLQVTSAGHGPLLFYSSNNDVIHSHDAQGPPLGILPHSRYRGSIILKFAPGDILVVVTDGLLEWANADDEDFGQNRLGEVIRAYRDMPSARIISELYSAVVKFAGSMPQLDDLTALVVKRV